MRENRTSGSMRGEQSAMHGMRLMSQRGNPATDVCRNLNVVTCSSTLLVLLTHILGLCLLCHL